MKKIFLYGVICSHLLISCKNSWNSNIENEKKGKKITARNNYINASNSYSDLFLDSGAVEKCIIEKNIPDSISRRLLSFYNSRNFQFAWFSSDGLTEQARGFWNLHNHHTSSSDDTILDNKELKQRMDYLITNDSITPSAKNKSFINTELQLTAQFIRHTLLAYESEYVKRKEMERFIPSIKQDALYLADSLLKKKHKDDKYYEDVNPSYGALKKNLALYHDIHTKGGWPLIPNDKKVLKKGMTSPEIILIKKRLQLTADMDATDTSMVFTDTLETGVKKFQRRHGLKADGLVNKTTLTEMNVPVSHRIQQLLINMDRMRWLPVQPQGDLLLVNIPAFILHAIENNKKVFDMEVVVGKEGHDTRVFTGNLNQVVFSPYWNVPVSIVKNEILPAIEKDPGYLESHNMEQTGENNGVPEIRQRPGGDNALGKVKFLFPNSFNIYFHDTPSKSLFASNKRAFSHGCIRLSDPERMANYLLRNNTEWNASKINTAMNRGEEKFVPLKKPVPVLITYYTAWADEEGELNFREDIYGHDRQLMKKMFTRTL
ncbi:MAG: L,D-transpeptidase family protein [Chitinophagaceae bacterium]